MKDNSSQGDLSLVEITQQQILDLVTKEDSLSGKILPKEDELANELGVSRVIIREALSRLRALGFLETKKKKGSVLLSPKPFEVMGVIINSRVMDESSVRDLYELRLMLEVGIADFVFERKNQEGMSKLLELIKEEEECEDSMRLVEIDIEFHTVLYKMASSASLSNFQSMIGKIFTLYPIERPKNWRAQELVTHRSLYYILQNGSPDAFRSAMRLHLTYQFENRDKYLKAYYEKATLNETANKSIAGSQ